MQAGVPFELTLSGYMAMFGVYTEQVIAGRTEPVAEVEIVRGTSAETLSSTGLTTDENGKVTLTFDTPGNIYRVGNRRRIRRARCAVVRCNGESAVRACVAAGTGGGGVFAAGANGRNSGRSCGKVWLSERRPVTGVSALDALVRAHELLFGEMLTTGNRGRALAVNNGSISRVFGEDTTNFWLHGQRCAAAR